MDILPGKFMIYVKVYLFLKIKLREHLNYVMLITYFIMCSEIIASACGPKYSTVCQKMASLTTTAVSVYYHIEMDSRQREIAIKEIQDAIDSTGRNGSCHNSLLPRNQAITMDKFFFL